MRVLPPFTAATLRQIRALHLRVWQCRELASGCPILGLKSRWVNWNWSTWLESIDISIESVLSDVQLQVAFEDRPKGYWACKDFVIPIEVRTINDSPSRPSTQTELSICSQVPSASNKPWEIILIPLSTQRVAGQNAGDALTTSNMDYCGSELPSTVRYVIYV
jgi:hypothetical protein